MASVLQMTKRLVGRPADLPRATVTLRTFRGEQDIEPWIELRRHAFARAKLGVRDWSSDDFQQEFLHKPWWRADHLWFAQTHEETPKLVGSVALAMRGEAETAFPVVHWLLVRPGHRRQGIGRLLMTKLEQTAWDEGHRQIALETHAKWVEAVSLYQRLGYQSV